MTRARSALAALGLSAAVVGIPAQPVHASSTICVGIVVDYGVAKPGGGANSACVRVSAGANGADVLAARARALGRPAPTYRSGFVCTIDGYPNDGSCGDPAPGGGFRYWGYYHQFPGSSAWIYSRVGATGFTVADGSVEGWSFQNGEPPPGRAPAPAGYGSICRASTSPTPKAIPTSRPSPSRSAPGPSVRRSTAPPAGRPSPVVSAAPTAVRRTVAPGPSRSAPPPSSPTPTLRSAPPAVTALAPVEPPRGSPSRAPIATLAGVALAGGIGAAALLRTRSRRKAGGER